MAKQPKNNELQSSVSFISLFLLLPALIKFTFFFLLWPVKRKLNSVYWIKLIYIFLLDLNVLINVTSITQWYGCVIIGVTYRLAFPLCYETAVSNNSKFVFERSKTSLRYSFIQWFPFASQFWDDLWEFSILFSHQHTSEFSTTFLVSHSTLGTINWGLTKIAWYLKCFCVN